MGVSGLLPVLKSIQEHTTLDRYRGKTLAIDSYAWLHKASFSCAEDIVLERPTKAYISYFKKKIDMLKYFNITPYFVFDGDYLPSKGNTEKEREIRRSEYKKLAFEAKKNGNKKLAFNYYQKACDISPELAKSLINELKIKFIKYVVAPYEADSQMVMLEKMGLVDGIISEDSDLLIFGCKTLITKLNDKGECIEIKRDNFKNCKGSYINSFNDDQLLLMSTISGCDYTKGIPGIGIQKAISLTQFYKTYERVIMSIKVEGKNIPENFDEEFKRAKIAFRHQIVFNPIDKLAQHLNPLTEDIMNKYSKEYIQSCTGLILNQEIHKKISIGDLDPFTKQNLISWENKVNPLLNRSISLPNQTINSFDSNNNKNLIFRSKTIDNIQNSKIESKPITKKRKSTMKIDQFTKFIRSKQPNLNEQNNNNNDKITLSPIAKRQKLLNNNENGQITISKFFNNKKDLINDIKIDEFPATSSDVEDITEDDINGVNMNLNDVIKNDNELSDNNIISESEEDDNNDNNDNKTSLLESDIEDILDSSQLSQSTITMDKPFNYRTPTMLMNEGVSLSSTLSADAGEINTECYIDDEEIESKDFNDINEDNENTEELIVDKSNLLAEIYSFNSNSNKNTKLINKNENENFQPDKWLNNKCVNNKGKIYKPSPLNKRIPLQDVTARVNIRNNNNNNNNHNNDDDNNIMMKLKVDNNNKNTNINKSGMNKSKLSMFRYIAK